MRLNTDHLLQCITTLESSLTHLYKALPDSIDYEIFRNAAIKGFELTLETAGKLMRKTLKLYTGSPRAVDELTYKDILRDAHKHGFLNAEEVERWFKYRDNRNDTAHDYGKAFAEETVKLLPRFLTDVRELLSKLEAKLGKTDA